MEILEDCLTLKEGQAKEHYWKKYYEDNGFNILNKGATGVGRSSLGSIGFGKWTQKSCFEEAQKYTSRSEFKQACGSAYSAALKKGWLKDYVWFGPSKREPWTYEKCKLEAMKYEYRMDFVRKSCGAYYAACKHHWIDSFDWFKQPISARLKWTYETCYETAKQYKTKIEFENAYPGAMNAARKNGWLKDYTWFVSGRKKT